MTALTLRSRLLLIVALALTSGAVMSMAGYAWRTDGWAVAGVVTVPGGLLIVLALALLPKNTHRQDTQRRTASGGLPIRYSVAASLLALAAGGVMVGAGYAGAGSAWLLTAALVLLGGVVITAALVVAVIGHQHAATRTRG